MTPQFTVALAVTVLTLALFSLTSCGDFEEAQRAEAAYCERVEAGVHTDYKELCP